MTEAKVNLKGKYDELECGACGSEEETQQHMIKHEELNKNKDSAEVEYSKLLNGTVLEKLKIANVFEDNFKSLEVKIIAMCHKNMNLKKIYVHIFLLK